MAYLGEFLSTPLAFFVPDLCATVVAPDKGDAVILHSIRLPATDSEGWTSVETVIVRLATRFVPSGRFPVYFNMSYTPTISEMVGYDAAVCVHKYEPWIIEAYNTSTGPPSALRIVEKGNGSTSPSPSGSIRGAPIANTRYLNATKMDLAFSLAYGNSIYQMEGISGWDGTASYFPSPSVGPLVFLYTIFL